MVAIWQHTDAVKEYLFRCTLYVVAWWKLEKALILWLYDWLSTLDSFIQAWFRWHDRGCVNISSKVPVESKSAQAPPACWLFFSRKVSRLASNAQSLHQGLHYFQNGVGVVRGKSFVMLMQMNQDTSNAKLMRFRKSFWTGASIFISSLSGVYYITSGTDLPERL